MFEDDDAIGVFDGAETVGDDDGGASFHQAIKGFFDEEFAFCVKGAGGFVEDQDAWIFEYGSRNGHPLFLST
jgi:hypothetical protein